MAVSLISEISASVKWLYTNPLDLSTPSDSKTLNFEVPMLSGTGLDQANRLFADQRSVNTASNDDLDLAGGLTDAFGQTLTFAKIKAILIYNTILTAGEILNVGGGGVNSFINWVGNASDTVTIGPGGLLVLANPSLAGYAVTASTGDILRIANAGAGTIVYKIVLIGTQ